MVLGVWERRIVAKGPSWGQLGNVHLCASAKRLLSSTARTAAGKDDSQLAVLNPLNAETLRFWITHNRDQKLAPILHSDHPEHSFVFVLDILFSM